MTEILLKIIILIWPFGQFLSYLVNGQRFYLLDLVSFLLLVSLVVHPKTRKQIFTDLFTRYLGIFLIATTLSLVVNSFSLVPSQLLRSLFYLARLFVYPSIYYAVKASDFKRIKSSVVTSVYSFVILCLAQYIVFPDARDLKYLGFDDHYYRIIGTFFDPNFTGLSLSVISLYFLSKSEYLLSLVFVPLVALTFSRATYITYALGAMAVTIKRNAKIALALLFFLSVAVFLAPKPFGEGVNLLRTFSIYSRMDSWKVGIDLFLRKPLFGWGYNTLTDLGGQRIGIDNSFIYLMATSGIFGITSFLYLISHMIKRISKTNFLICILAILFHSLFNNSLFFIWIFSLFWLLYGLSQKDQGL